MTMPTRPSSVFPQAIWPNQLVANRSVAGYLKWFSAGSTRQCHRRRVPFARLPLGLQRDNKKERQNEVRQQT